MLTNMVFIEAEGITCDIDPSHFCVQVRSLCCYYIQRGILITHWKHFKLKLDMTMYEIIFILTGVLSVVNENKSNCSWHALVGTVKKIMQWFSIQTNWECHSL